MLIIKVLFPRCLPHTLPCHTSINLLPLMRSTIQRINTSNGQLQLALPNRSTYQKCDGSKQRTPSKAQIQARNVLRNQSSDYKLRPAQENVHFAINERHIFGINVILTYSYGHKTLSREYSVFKGKYHCTADLLFYLFGFSCYAYVE